MYQELNPGIEYEYSIPTSAARETLSRGYNWMYNEFTECNATCGGGMLKLHLLIDYKISCRYGYILLSNIKFHQVQKLETFGVHKRMTQCQPLQNYVIRLWNL